MIRQTNEQTPTKETYLPMNSYSYLCPSMGLRDCTHEQTAITFLAISDLIFPTYN